MTHPPLPRLAGKRAVITGAARGIGRAIAELYAREGADVMIADLDLAAASATAAEIAAATGRKVVGQACDVARKRDCAAMIAAAEAALGGVDILVCNAGIVRPGVAIEEIEEATWEKVIGVNLLGAVYPTQVFAPLARAQGSGRIIYMASVAGEVGGVAAEITYSVTKAAVLCLTKAVAKQLAPHGVTVNAIAPGAIETAMTEILQYPPSVKAGIPLGRYGAAGDIAEAALYLASEAAGYVTGTTLDVNGGMYMR